MQWITIPPFKYTFWYGNYGYISFQPCMHGKFRACLPKSDGYSFGEFKDCDTLEDAKYLVERNNVVWC
jgi:hypothetical protein